MKLRVAIFSSFHHGERLTKALLVFQEEHPDLVDFCGIATDDPFHPRSSPQKRIWQYVSEAEKKESVEEICLLAKKNKISVWQENIKSEDFLNEFKKWNPDIVYMNTFGQLVPAQIFERPRCGFLNLHPTVDTQPWPAYAGGNPFLEMVANHETHGAFALYKVNENFDDGKPIAYSANFAIYPHDDVVSLHNRTIVEATNLVEWHLRSVLGLPQPRYGVQLTA